MGNTNKPRILYVDDDPQNLRAFKNAFKEEFEIYIAETGEEGLTILDNTEVNLIISDQRMPKMSGVQFLEKVMKSHPGPNRILMTAYSDFEAIIEAINKGKIYQYIQKPWDKENIVPILNQSIEIYNLKRKNDFLHEKIKVYAIQLEEQLKEKEELLSQLQQALLKAQESDKLKTSFLRNISHEIRTPMNGILGFVQIMLEEDLPRNQQIDYLKFINTSSERLLNFLNQLIEYSSLQSKLVSPVKSHFFLNDLAESVFSTFCKNLDSKSDQITFIKEFPDNKVSIHTDENKLNIALSMILKNAFKFTKSGKITLGFVNTSSSAHLYIKDTGIGISPNNQHLVFTPFCKIEEDAGSVYEGIGLGLTIAKEYIELLGGEINFKSEYNSGTTFNIYLPLK